MIKLTETLEKLLTKDGWKETFIGIFSNDDYTFYIDNNSGGVAIVSDKDGQMVDYLSEDCTALEFWDFYDARITNGTLAA